jgi:beta-glucanase (GH16 family)
MHRARRGRFRAVVAVLTALAAVVMGVALGPVPVSASIGGCNLLSQLFNQCRTPSDITAPPVTTDPLPPAPGACGGEQPVKQDGTPWACTFDEEFTGDALNRNVWTVQTTAAGGFHSGAECFVDSPDNVSVGGGTLNLTVRQTPQPFTCGSYQTQYTSGSVYTTNFDQVYGRFEVRARFAEAGGKPGLQGALWLYPRLSEATQRGGPTEIDIAEAYSLYPNLVMPTVHTNGGGTHNCSVPDYGAAFHTYAAEWTASVVTFYYDGVPCFRVAPSFLGLPLNSLRTTTPFFVALTQALGIGRNVNTPDTPLPATLQIDYVRVWS